MSKPVQVLAIKAVPPNSDTSSDTHRRCLPVLDLCSNFFVCYEESQSENFEDVYTASYFCKVVRLQK